MTCSSRHCSRGYPAAQTQHEFGLSWSEPPILSIHHRQWVSLCRPSIGPARLVPRRPRGSDDSSAQLLHPHGEQFGDGPSYARSTSSYQSHSAIQLHKSSLNRGSAPVRLSVAQLWTWSVTRADRSELHFPERAFSGSLHPRRE